MINQKIIKFKIIMDWLELSNKEMKKLEYYKKQFQI
jgi:hypothetical protein